jgi:hypothetical protein
VFALCGVTAAAILTKGTSYALVPAVAVAILIGFLRCPRSKRLDLGLPYALAGLVLIVPVYIWVRIATATGRPAFNTVGVSSSTEPIPFKLGDFLAYIWQFYLPRLPFMSLDRTTPGYSVYNVWIREAWGTFGWLEFGMPTWIYTVVGSLTAAIGLVSAGILATVRGAVRWELVLFFALGCFGLLLGLHYTEYRTIIDREGTILQGRYLLPVLGLFGLAVGLIISRIPGRFRAPTTGVVLVALLALQVVALATVAARYYT